MKMLLAAVLSAGILCQAPAFAQAPKKTVAPPAVQQEFTAFIAKFRAALKANDPAAVAALTKLPFMADASISDAAQFRAKTYRELLDAKTRACIQRTKAIYDRDGESNDFYYIFCGETIFTFTRTPTGFLFTDVGVND